MNENHRPGANNNNNKSSQSPYHESSDLLNRILNKMESSSKHKNSSSYNQILKSSITNKEGKLQVSSKTYAIVTKVLQNKSKIDALITGTNILTDSHPIKNMGLFYVMIYELLFASSPQQRKYGTSNKIKGGGTVKRYILQHESILRQKYQEYYGTTTTNTNHQDENDNDDHHNSHRPFQHRFVRVNTCVTTVNDFLQFYSTMLKDAIPEGTIRAGSITERIYRDEHVPDLLVIPALLTSQLLSALQNQNKGNHIVLQDKSSCLPAVCLHSLLQLRQPQPSPPEMNRHGRGPDIHVVLDACAAPGNKTSHIAAVLQQLPTYSLAQSLPPERHFLYATDRNVERCHTLQDRMTLLVPTGNIDVVVQNKDFLTISGNDEDRDNEYTKLTCIVLDPSCSGSGLYHRNSTADMNAGIAMGHSHSSDGQQQRIQKLSNFQITCLRHALTSFPNVHTVIYSTCSIHVLENEHVVASVLSNHNNHPNDNDSPNLRDEWSIVAPPDLQDWPRRGMDLRRTTNSGTGGDDEEDEDDKIPNDPTGEPDVAELYGDLTPEEIQCFIRTTIEDRTNGFFVACFQRNSTEKNRKSRNGPSQPPPRPPPDDYHHSIPTYRGEFDQLSETREVVVKDRHTRKRHAPIGNDRKTTGSATMDTASNTAAMDELSTTGSSRQKRQRDTRVATTTGTSLSTSTTGTPAATNHSKKRAKKLEWKQRQHEAKRQRTKSEKGNQKSETSSIKVAVLLVVVSFDKRIDHNKF